MGIRSKLHPQSIGIRTYLPPACHTLSRKDKQFFCQCLRSVKVPQGYYINNHCFYSKIKDDKNRVQNSGVTLQAEIVHFTSSKDKNPITTSMSYFRIIHEIWEVDYITFRVLVFKCKWVDSNSGVGTDDIGFTLVDLNKMSDIDEPFIMASQARQFFYVIDPANKKWSVVLEGRSMQGNDDEDCLDILETTSFSSRTTQDKVDDVTNDIYAI